MDTCQYQFLFKKNRKIPKGLCPQAFHTIYPYYFSYKHNSHFRWRSKKDVVCQCPQSKGVTFLVKNNSGQITAKVLSVGSCPYKYKASQKFHISPQSYPSKTLSTLTPLSCSILDKLPSSLKIKVIGFKEPCLFFKKIGQSIQLKDITPGNICPDLFYLSYPQYLCSLYNNKKISFDISCPPQKTKWKLTSKKLPFSLFIDLIYKFLKFFNIYKDLVNKKITLECIYSNDCPKSYTPPNQYNFNHYYPLFGKQFFCPAVFYTLYPFLVDIALHPRNQKFPLIIQCPADNASITFEITL